MQRNFRSFVRSVDTQVDLAGVQLNRPAYQQSRSNGGREPRFVEFATGKSYGLNRSNR
jgi:hypothetical protein